MKSQVAPYETRALCLRIECTTGLIYRITRYPVDLTMSNNSVYLTGTGFDFTSYQATSTMSPSAIDLEGFVGFAGITRAAISSGIFDNARCYLFACDFNNPVEDYEPMIASILGKVTLEDDRYKIEEMALIDALNQSVGKTYTAQCPKVFGGTEYAGCMYPISNCTVSGTITSVTSSSVFTDSSIGQATDYFGLGTIRFTSGLNSQVHPGGDVLWANNVLVMHMNGAEDGTIFTDEMGHSATINGTSIVTKTSTRKFGTASIYSNGVNTSNNLQFPASTDWALNSGNFSIDGWIYLTAYNGNGGRIASACGSVVTWNSTTGIHWLIQSESQGIQFVYWRGGTTSSVSIPMELNTFHHFAFTFDGDLVRAFKNGVLISTSSYAPQSPSTTPQLNLFTIYNEVSSFAPFSGYLDDLRITKGAYRWNNNFSPPTIEATIATDTVSIGIKEIKSYGAGGVIEVYEPFYYTVAPGDTYIMTGGCRKRLVDCRDKWNNVVNFGGFSFIPTSSQYSQVGTK